MAERSPTQRLLLTVLLGIAAAFLTEGLWRVDLLSRMEAGLQDYWHVWRGERDGPIREAPVLFVRVDDTTLEQLPNPYVFWGPHFAQVFETLSDNGASAIGLDFLIKVSGEEFFNSNGFSDLAASRSWDASFRGALFKGNVVLVSTLVRSSDGEAYIDVPLGEYQDVLRDSRSRLGLDNLPNDTDNIVRRFWPQVVPGEEGPGLSLGLALTLMHLGLDAHASSWEIAGRSIDAEQVERIVFSGPPGTLPSLPFWKLLEPDALSDAERALIKGRVVVVGAAHTNTPDIFATPYDLQAGTGPMYGAELHGHVAATLLSGARLSAPGDVERLGLFLGLGLISALLFFRVTLRTAVGLTITLGTLPLLGFFLFIATDILLPVTGCAFVSVMTFGGAYALRFSGEQRERAHLRSVFGRYLAEDVVDEILASPEGVRLGGERREVTILMSDIRNFTTISEQMEPEEVVEMLNAWFKLSCKPILDRGGVVDKFIGDAIMAVFGAPVTRPDAAGDALESALEMATAALEFRSWMRERFPEKSLPDFDIGVGVHSGTAVIGNIGHEQRIEYTVIGDAVNVAARIEGLTKTVGCRVLASRAALETSRRTFDTGRTAELQVKGRLESVEVVELIDQKESPPDPATEVAGAK